VSFFIDSIPRDKKIIRAELDGLDNAIRAIATEEPQIISEWEEIYIDVIKNIEKILIDNTETDTLKNFIGDNLHPRGKKAKVRGYKKAIITLKKGQNIDLTTGI
jgi:ribosomal protein L23